MRRVFTILAASALMFVALHGSAGAAGFEPTVLVDSGTVCGTEYTAVSGQTALVLDERSVDGQGRIHWTYNIRVRDAEYYIGPGPDTVFISFTGQFTAVAEGDVEGDPWGDWTMLRWRMTSGGWATNADGERIASTRLVIRWVPGGPTVVNRVEHCA